MTNNFDAREAKKALISRILDGAGEATSELRRAAFDNTALEEPLRSFIARVATDPVMVADEHFATLKMAGFSEEQLFELTICAALGEASRHYDASLLALDAATATEGKSDAT